MSLRWGSVCERERESDGERREGKYRESQVESAARERGKAKALQKTKERQRLRARDWPRVHGSVGNLAILAPKARPRLQTAPITEPALASLVPFPSSAPICHLLVRALRARPVRLAHCALMPTPTTHHYHHYHHHSSWARLTLRRGDPCLRQMQQCPPAREPWKGGERAADALFGGRCETVARCFSVSVVWCMAWHGQGA